MESVIKELLEEILNHLETSYKKIKITEEKKKKLYHVNIETDESSILIGYHGETIFAIQHILKTLLWQKEINNEYTIFLDIDNYRKRQEESVLAMAERKAEMVRKTGKDATLLPMSPYFRRIVHLHFMTKEFEDVETESIGEGNHRQVIIKRKEKTE
ncbi:KH domain-containing protein [Candidatus Peregrinibacteria bacterium]|nr:KH domain-containing protein [Candidatus Peregrinibacteria bacterium]